MLLFGILLFAAAGAFTGLLIADNLDGGPEYQVTVLGHDLVTLNSLGVFLAGLALALLFCLGLLLAGAGRSLRRARAVKHGRHAAPAAVRPEERTAERPGARSEDRVMERRITDDRISDEPAVREPAVREPVVGRAARRADEEAGAPEDSPRRGRGPGRLPEH
ncbi:hypothetical protein ACIPYS_29310 [Kitasatospora sp. NPDC089913]|uniref:hypothetical protein n=1 Tax=Kitasatospora sp. NPDC089913 TaxID=3364080 RepID=UPI0038221930